MTIINFDFSSTRNIDSLLFTPQVLKSIYFDDKSKRYKWKDGNRFVSKNVVRDLIDKKIDEEKQKLRDYSPRIKAQEIGVYGDVGKTLKNLHILEAAKARDGFENISNSDLGTIGNQLKKQYYQGVGLDGKPYGIKFLIADAPNLSEAQISNRLRMYGESAQVSGSALNQNFKMLNGATQSRRILGKTDNHCKECLQYAAMGWQPIGTLPLPKTKCTCRSNCLCDIVYA